MKNLILKSGKLPECVIVPRSKSYANRLLLLAALFKNEKTITSVPDSTDVTNLINAFHEIGLQILKTDQKIRIVNSFPNCEDSTNFKELKIDVGDGGTTARFLATMLLLGKKKYLLRLGSRLKDRPWDEFIDLAGKLGAQVSLNQDILTIQGPIKVKGDLSVDCKKTTQFASGFQMVLSVFGLKVIPENLDSSRSYWELTQKLIESFMDQDYFDVPIDWSSASYAMTFAALNHEIFFPKLNVDPFQSDSKLLQILESYHCIQKISSGIRVLPIQINKDMTLDVSDCLDLVPSLSFLLAHKEGIHQLSGIQNLVYKESDRLQEVIFLLKKFNKKTELNGDTLVIKGDSTKLKDSIKLVLPDDHRMVMVGSLFLRHHAGGEIYPADAVRKSYPNFFELFK